MTPQDANEVVPYLTSASAIVYVQQWLKSRELYARFVKAFPGVDKHAHWAIAAVGSFFVAAGIHMTYSGTWAEIWQHGGSVLIHIPSGTDMLHGMGDWAKVYLLQHTVYRATHQPAYVPPAPQP